MGEPRYWLHTLGCPKNQVDSDKLEGTLAAAGYRRGDDVEQADLVVVNTCAFIEEARAESIDAVLSAAALRRPGARLVVTGCLAERYPEDLRQALPEVDLVAPFGVPLVAGPEAEPSAVQLGPTRRGVASFDLLALPRPAARAPWAYVKAAEGCDRRCGFCAIPSFRGRQRSRPAGDVLAEVASLVEGGRSEDRDGTGPPVREIVLVAQDLASYGRDRSSSHRAGSGQPLVALTRAVAGMVERTRLLYLYPSGLTDQLIEAVLATGVPYFDLSLQHVARPLLARMRRHGDGERFLRRIEEIRRAEPDATFRSSFIVGYPGETEDDHDRLLEFLGLARLDWAGFFTFSPEDGTVARDLPGQVPRSLAMERLRECTELQDGVTRAQRDRWVGRRMEVLVDAPGTARTVHEAPEIDGVVAVPDTLPVGSLVEVDLVGSTGTDLVGQPVPVTVGSA